MTAVEPRPDDLRRRADEIESRECTGYTAEWCPVHGQCSHNGDREQPRCYDDDNDPDPSCPLHSMTSVHAAAEIMELSRG